MIRVAIRLRSGINVKPDTKETLRLLRLNKVNHCVLVPSDKVHNGMLLKVKDYITWGEVKPEILARLILTRGRLVGDHPIDNNYIKKNTEHDSLVKFATDVANEKVPYTSVKNVKPLFRLHPPLQGHEGIKHSFRAGGALGYRGDHINDMIIKMLGPEAKKKPEKKEATTKKPAKTKAPISKASPKKTVPKKAIAKKEKKTKATPKTAAKKVTKKEAKK